MRRTLWERALEPPRGARRSDEVCACQVFPAHVVWMWLPQARGVLHKYSGGCLVVCASSVCQYSSFKE